MAVNIYYADGLSGSGRELNYWISSHWLSHCGWASGRASSL